MRELQEQIAARKAALDRLRQTNPIGLALLEQLNLDEITRSSLYLEPDNSLEPGEMLHLLTTGTAIGGKPLKDHWAVLDHRDAVRFAADRARDARLLTEADLSAVHALVVQHTHPADAGAYDLTGPRFMPQATFTARVRDFAGWLTDAPATPDTAFTAHDRLMTLQPFAAGNNVTARLFMNLVLLQGGYPALAIWPREAGDYRRTYDGLRPQPCLEERYGSLYRKLDAALGEFITALELPQPRLHRAAANRP